MSFTDSSTNSGKSMKTINLQLLRAMSNYLTSLTLMSSMKVCFNLLTMKNVTMPLHKA